MKRSSRRSDCASMASSDAFLDDNSSVEMDSDNKRKSRNLSEKKRRDQFNVLLNELCSMVRCDGFPVEDASSSSSSQQHSSSGVGSSSSASTIASSMLASRKMDKSSILRSTIDFLKLYYESKKSSKATSNENEQEGLDITDEEECSDDSWKPPFLSYEEFSYLMLDALDAFILIFDPDIVGNIAYASESMHGLLGYNHKRRNQNDDHHRLAHDQDVRNLTGEPPPDSYASCVPSSSSTTVTSVYDLIHESDVPNFRSWISSCQSQQQQQQKSVPDVCNDVVESFASTDLHMKKIRSTPTTFELIHLIGYVSQLPMSSSSGNNNQNVSSSGGQALVSIGRLQRPKILKELRIIPTLDIHYFNKEFASRHSLEWKFLFLDHRATSLIGYMPFEVLGTSGYDYYHWDDLAIVVAGHEQLMQRGEGTSQQYRFLTKGQQWIWLRTRSYITYHQWNSKPEFIVCTHTITGFDQQDSEEQQDNRSSRKQEHKNSSPDVATVTPITVTDVQQHNNHSHQEKQAFDHQTDLEMVSLASSSLSGSRYRNPHNHHSHHSALKRKAPLYLSDSLADSTAREYLPSSGYHSSTGSSSDQSDPSSDSVPVKHDMRSHLSSEPLSNSSNMMSDSFPAYPTLRDGSESIACCNSSSITSVTSSGFTDASDAQLILRKKHSVLQAQIQQQQEELRRMEEQLFTPTFDPLNQNQSYGTSSSSSLRYTSLSTEYSFPDQGSYYAPQQQSHQEMDVVMPDTVSHLPDHPQTLDYQHLTPYHQQQQHHQQHLQQQHHYQQQHQQPQQQQSQHQNLQSIEVEGQTILNTHEMMDHMFMWNTSTV